LSAGTKLPSNLAKKKKAAVPKQQRIQQQALVNQGVLMNNFFPALEGGSPEGETPISQKDQLYPKFGVENLNNNPNMVVQDQIDEVPQE
jgi:hypothetical protein